MSDSKQGNPGKPADQCDHKWEHIPDSGLKVECVRCKKLPTLEHDARAQEKMRQEYDNLGYEVPEGMFSSPLPKYYYE